MLWFLYMTLIILQKVVFLLMSDSVNLFTDSFTVPHKFSSKDTLHFVRNSKSHSSGVRVGIPSLGAGFCKAAVNQQEFHQSYFGVNTG